MITLITSMIYRPDAVFGRNNYPNKKSLMFAVLEDSLNHVASSMEAACEQSCYKPLSEMIKNVVEAFVDAKPPS
jgi:hypothetical protein